MKWLPFIPFGSYLSLLFYIAIIGDTVGDSDSAIEEFYIILSIWIIGWLYFFIRKMLSH